MLELVDMARSFFTKYLLTFGLLTLVVGSSITSFAQVENLEMKTVEVAETKVGVRVISPFVNKNADGSYFGFSIDLWNKISGSAKLPTTKFQEFENVGSLIDSVEKKNVDVGIAAISITSDRESRVDFSQPMFDAGLQIMVPGDVQPQSSGPKEFFSKIFNALWNEAFLYLVLSIALLGFILANIAYVLERMHPSGIFSDNYFVGVIQAFWWSMSALASQADHNPATRQGRTLAVIWMYFSVIFLTFFQAQITSDLTAAKLQGEINSVSDLSGKNVISIKSSTASKFLTSKGIIHTEIQNLDEAFGQVSAGKVDAFVYDAPPMAYFTSHSGLGKVHLVGDIFKPESYGIAFPQNSELQNKVDLALLSLKEDGSYQELYDKYFGVKK